jgi:hypothetical protein
VVHGWGPKTLGPPFAEIAVDLDGLLRELALRSIEAPVVPKTVDTDLESLSHKAVSEPGVDVVFLCYKVERRPESEFQFDIS